jgi:hypothetical protein
MLRRSFIRRWPYFCRCDKNRRRSEAGTSDPRSEFRRPRRPGRGTPCLFTTPPRCFPEGRSWSSFFCLFSIAADAAFPSMYAGGVTGVSGIANRRAGYWPSAGSTGRRRSVIARRRTAGNAAVRRHAGIVVFTQKNPWMMRVPHRGLFRLLSRHGLPEFAGSAAGQGGL